MLSAQNGENVDKKVFDHIKMEYKTKYVKIDGGHSWLPHVASRVSVYGVHKCL